MSTKYPKTSHFPWSPCCSDDDKRMKTARAFVGRPLVMTEKLDGGNVRLTSEVVHARSHAKSPVHVSMDWLKAFHARNRHLIPDGHSIFCEYTYAIHNIEYHELPSYLWIIRVRDDSKDIWLPWRGVEAISKQLAVPTVPVLVISSFSTEQKLQKEVERQATDLGLYGKREGVVVSPLDSFFGEDFETVVGKDVRVLPAADGQNWLRHGVKKQNLVKLVEATA